MISAYKQGVPADSKSFPEGSKIVKIEWVKKKESSVTLFCLGPGHSKKSLSFIVKEFQEFPEHERWSHMRSGTTMLPPAR